jgi:hypothetical protein
MNNNKKQQILDEVEKTLNSFDNDIVLEGNPFLLTRIKTVMNARRQRSGAGEFVKRVLIPAAVLLILGVNIFTMTHYVSWNARQTADKKLVTALKAEYQIDQSDQNF